MYEQVKRVNATTLLRIHEHTWGPGRGAEGLLCRVHLSLVGTNNNSARGPSDPVWDVKVGDDRLLRPVPQFLAGNFGASAPQTWLRASPRVKHTWSIAVRDPGKSGTCSQLATWVVGPVWKPANHLIIDPGVLIS